MSRCGHVCEDADFTHKTIEANPAIAIASSARLIRVSGVSNIALPSYQYAYRIIGVQAYSNFGVILFNFYRAKIPLYLKEVFTLFAV